MESEIKSSMLARPLTKSETNVLCYIASVVSAAENVAGTLQIYLEIGGTVDLEIDSGDYGPVKWSAADFDNLDRVLEQYPEGNVRLDGTTE